MKNRNKQIIETPRLLLREMSQNDLPALSQILQDEETMYAYEGAFSNEETQAWLDKNLSRYENDGFGLWAVILKNNSEMVGQAGITRQDIGGETAPEIGYLFNRAYWKKGYATEAAVACKQYGFTKLGFNEMVSVIRDINIPSMNVAIRNGMQIKKLIVRNYRGIDMPHYVFCVKK